MKLFSKPETAADFGITYTGDDLKRFNHKFKKLILDTANRPTKETIFAYTIGIASLVANIYIAYRNATNLFTMVATIALPISLVVVFIYSLFEKNNTIRKTLSKIAIGSNFVLFASIGVAALVGNMLFNYLLFVASLVIGLIIGVHNWGKKTMKDLPISDEAVKADSKLPHGIIIFIAAALVPIARSLSEHEAAMSIFGVLSVMAFCVIFGWLMGIGITNIRYYKFLKKQK